MDQYGFKGIVKWFGKKLLFKQTTIFTYLQQRIGHP